MSLHFDMMRVRNAIYDLFMNNPQYFRENGMFDSDDDIELEIDEQLYNYIKNGKKIIYCSKPPVEFDKKIKELFDIIAE